MWSVLLAVSCVVYTARCKVCVHIACCKMCSVFSAESSVVYFARSKLHSVSCVLHNLVDLPTLKLRDLYFLV